MTLEDARKELARIGYTIRKKEGEYRIVRKGESERWAYYTTDLQDAVDTAFEEWRNEPEPMPEDPPHDYMEEHVMYDRYNPLSPWAY